VGWLARLFGNASPDQRPGIALEDREPWQVGATKDVERFLRAVPVLGGDGTFIYFEDTLERHVRDYLGSVSVEPSVRVQTGTIWPQPDCHHLPLTGETMEALAGFLERQPAALLSIHVLVYRDAAVLLQWYDAFDAPLYLARTIPESTVAAFAGRLGSRYSIGW
jgi:hypothetical protein